jgi:hypothetical protein
MADGEQLGPQDDELDFRPTQPAPQARPTAVSDGIDFQPATAAVSKMPRPASQSPDEMDFRPAEKPATFESLYNAPQTGPSLSERAAQVGQPSPLVQSFAPKTADLTQVPRSPFTNRLELAPPMRTEEETQREGTIRPREQTFGERALRALGAGAPEGSKMAEWTGQPGTKDNLRLFAPEELMTESEQARHPILTGAGEFAGGFSSPESLMLLGLTAGAGRLAGPGAQTMKRLLAAGFSGSMIFNAAQKVPDVAKAIQTGDAYNAERLLTHVVLSTIAGALAGRGTFEEPEPLTVPKGTISGKLAIDEASLRAARRFKEFEANNAAREGMGRLTEAERGIEAARQARINAPVEIPPTRGEPTILQGRPQGPERNPLEVEARQVREERAARERPAFNVRDLRRVVPENPEEPPYYVLGGPEPSTQQETISRPGAADLVGARGRSKGMSELASRVIAEREQSLEQRFAPDVLDEARQEMKAAGGLAGSFERPGRYFAAVGQTDEHFIREEPKLGIRHGGLWYGVTAVRPSVEAMHPWYRDVLEGPETLSRIAQEGKGAAYDRILGRVATHVQAERESARPIIEEYAPQLRDLAGQVRDVDPDLSQTLLDLAGGKAVGYRNMREYIEGKLHDAHAAALFSKAVDEAASEAGEPAGAAEPSRLGGEARAAEGRGEETARESARPITSPRHDGIDFEPSQPINPQEVEDMSRLLGRPITAEELPEIRRRLDAERNIAEGISGKRSKSIEEIREPYREKLEQPGRQEGVLPGMETAVREQREAAATEQGRQLTERANRPPESIEERAGLIERESPLFRGKGPQGELYETEARDDLLAPNDGSTLGTRYSGLSPAALKQLLPESLREKLDAEVRANQRARGLQGQLYDLESQNAADLIRSRNVLKEAPGTPGDMEAIYHHLEDPAVRLTAEQQKILDGYLRPILDESERINEKLEGGQVENYVHRIPIGKGSLLDRIMGGESKLSAGRGLSKSAASLKGRTMMALEDEAGNRRVVSIKDGRVTAFDHGQAEGLGQIRGLAAQGIKTRGAVLEREVEPMRRELDKLETERRTLTATKGRETSAARRIENIDDRAAELREGLQDAYRTDEGKLLSENDLRGRVFVDRNGEQWKITQATTREIEGNTDVRYYKNALASTVLNFLNLRRAERAYDFLESYKASPDFQDAAVKVSGARVPAGYRTTDLPQFHGYAFEPHTAEVLDWYSKRLRAGDPNVYRQVGNFLRTAIFFNPLIHTPNITVHWIVEKGLTGFGPQNWGSILRSGSKAINAVVHQNGDFLEALDAGAPLQSARLDNALTTKLFLERMGRELEADPTVAQRVGRALGYANPLKLVRAIYDFSSRATWTTNDIAMLQATYQHMEKTGASFKEAVTDVSKHIPDYRLPTRIFGSPALAKVMSSPELTMFGAYHYGALRSYGEMAKGLISEDLPPAERMKSLDRLAMLGLFTFVAYPALDQLAKYLTGDKSAQFRRAGASTFVWNLVQLSKGERSPTQVLESVATPAVHTKALLQLALNRDFFTGRHVVDWNADAKTIAAQLARYGGQQLAPVSQGMQVAERRRTLERQIAGLAGIKTNVPTPAEALAQKFAEESAGSSAPAQDTLERSYLRRQYEDDLRNRKITIQDLGHALTAHTITPEDAKIIVERAAQTPLQNALKTLPIEKALRVWDKADPQERASLRPLLRAKAQRMTPGRFTHDQWEKVRAGIIAALKGKAPAAEPRPSFMGIPLRISQEALRALQGQR